MADLEIQSDNEYYTVSFDAAPACSLGQRTVTVTYAPKVLDTLNLSSLVVYNGLFCHNQLQQPLHWQHHLTYVPVI